MNKIIIIFSVLIFVSINTDVFSQNNQIFALVDEPPVFPGGEDAFKDYIQNHLKYPEEAKKQKIEGKLYVKFVINEQGKAEDVKVARSKHPLLDKEAIRVIKNMPEWQPGKNDGENVKVRQIATVKFELK